MDISSALQYTPQQFQALYLDLMTLGSHNHEKLAIRTEGQKSFPVTAKKELFDLNKQDEKASRLVLEFLENHLDILIQQPDACDLFLKLNPLFEGKSRMDLNKIHQNFFRVLAEANAQATISQMFQESESKCKALTQAAQECLIQTEVRIKELDSRLAILKKEEGVLQDTLIVCKDGSLNAHIKLLETVVFFRISKDHLQNDMKKSSLSKEEAARYNFKFVFSDFNAKTMDIFIRWLGSPTTLHQQDNVDELLELYRLADFLSDDAFHKACFNQIKLKLNKEDALKILSSANYVATDNLIKACCDLIVKHFKEVKEHPQFVEIKAEYFKAIISDNFLHEINECQIFHSLIKWATEQADHQVITLKELLNDDSQGKAILESIRFEDMTKKDFMDFVLSLDILSRKMTNRWLSYFLYNGNKPRPRFYNLKCKIKNDKKANISWNIPAKLLDTVGEWNESKHYEENFFIQNCPWKIEVAKQKTTVVIGMRVENLQIDFEFFLEIHQLRIYSCQSDQKNIQQFQNNGKGLTSHVKAVVYELKTLKDHVDPTTNSLPLKIQLFIKS